MGSGICQAIMQYTSLLATLLHTEIKTKQNAYLKSVQPSEKKTSTVQTIILGASRVSANVGQNEKMYETD